MKTQSNDEFKAYVATIVLPEGFTGSFVPDDFDWKQLNFVVSSDDIKITFRAAGYGTTSFKVPDGWRTFDRRGVESSFYSQPLWEGDVCETNPNKIIAAQIAKAKQRQLFYKTAVAIPGLDGSFTIAPDEIENLKLQLVSRGSLCFTPAGFGTGYMVTKKKTHNLQKRAKPELESFLGASPLFVSTMDCD